MSQLRRISLTNMRLVRRDTSGSTTSPASSAVSSPRAMPSDHRLSRGQRIKRVLSRRRGPDGDGPACTPPARNVWPAIDALLEAIVVRGEAPSDSDDCWGPAVAALADADGRLQLAGLLNKLRVKHAELDAAPFDRLCHLFETALSVSLAAEDWGAARKYMQMSLTYYRNVDAADREEVPEASSSDCADERPRDPAPKRVFCIEAIRDSPIWSCEDFWESAFAQTLEKELECAGGDTSVSAALGQSILVTYCSNMRLVERPKGVVRAFACSVASQLGLPEEPVLALIDAV